MTLARSNRTPIVVVAGVAGSGKSTVGRALALRLDVTFIDADDYHSAESKARMHYGLPLEETARLLWLRRALDAAMAHHPAVLACSALTRKHRDLLRAPGDVHVMALAVGRAELERRLSQRSAHFAGATLLPSQLATWQPPGADEDAVSIDGEQDVDSCVEQIVRALR